MLKIRTIARQSFISLAVLVLVAGTPGAVYAQEAAPIASDTTASQEAVPATGAAPGQPGEPGAPGVSSTPATPATSTSSSETVTAPADASANSESPAPVLEAPMVLNADPVMSMTPMVSTATGSTVTDLPEQAPATGPTLELDLATDASVHNVINADATSGDVGTLRNTLVGNTTSGDAAAIANIINLLQSSASVAGTDAAVFSADIQGSVVGDFIIDPSALAQPASLSQTELQKLSITNSNANSIVNDVNLDALSGNASAVDNTTANNVGSGTASAVANVVNLINSTVASGQSFFGVINIWGDLIGNILMPAGALDGLLAGNLTLPGGSGGSGSETTIDNSTDQQIHNNVGLNAVSGEVTAARNTQVGNVASGDSVTNLTILNLTGRNIIAANSLLVFVNVLGSWVGLIMDAPQGTTSAALVGGRGGAMTGHDNQATLPAETAIDSDEQLAITNNISANARSGDAQAFGNTRVGNISSGAATASANIANIIGSNFALSNWFGVLFINVFGSWTGNFGVAKPPVTPTVVDNTRTDTGTGNVQQASLVGFTPRSSASSSSQPDDTEYGYSEGEGTVESAATMTNTVRKVLSSTNRQATGSPAADASVARANTMWSMTALAIGILGFLYYTIDRLRTNLGKR